MRAEDIRAGAIVVALILLVAIILDLLQTLPHPAPWWLEALAAFAIIGCGASAGAIWATRKL